MVPVQTPSMNSDSILNRSPSSPERAKTNCEFASASVAETVPTLVWFSKMGEKSKLPGRIGVSSLRSLMFTIISLLVVKIPSKAETITV